MTHETNVYVQDRPKDLFCTVMSMRHAKRKDYFKL